MPDSTIISPQNAGIAATIVTVIGTLRQIAPEAFATRFGKRLLPALPVILGLFGSLLGLSDAAGHPATTWKERLVVGFLNGAAASTLYQLAAKTMGSGPSAQPPTAPAAPVDPPSSAAG